MSNLALPLFNHRFYLFGSRAATHVVFWISYFLLFGLIWAKPETGLLGSYFLEFVLLPARIMAVYCMLYILMPQFLLARRFALFFTYYLLMLAVAGIIQRLSGHFFYDTLFLQSEGSLLDASAFGRSVLLVNSTVIFVAAIKLLQSHFALQQELANSNVSGTDILEIKSNRRTHLIPASQIQFVEGMGNYVTYHLQDNQKLIEYASIKATLARLPEHFIRLHKSYIVNLRHIDSYNQEDVSIGQQTLPRGKHVSDELLSI